MRILKLDIENFLTLAGHLTIDFEAMKGVDSVFCIFGKTGAGKSLIWDAICLALYGLRPRLASESLKSNEYSLNPVITPGVRETNIRLLFEGIDGQRYQAAWRQWIVRGSEDKVKEERAVSQVAADGSMKILAQKNETQIGALIEKALIGMTFAQFLRVVMLAQGQFDRFLHCKIDERAEILEELTGTEIYARVSAEIHRQFKEVITPQWNQLQVDYAKCIQEQGTAEEHAGNLSQQKNMNEALAKLENKLAELNKCLEWLDANEKLKNEEQECRKHREEFDAQDQPRLDQGLIVKALHEAECFRKWKEAAGKLPALSKSAEALKEPRDSAEQLAKAADAAAQKAHEEQKAQHLKIEPLQKRADLAQQRRPAYDKARQAFQMAKAADDEKDQTMQKQQAEVAKLEKALQELSGQQKPISDWLVQHSVDALLQEALLQSLKGKWENWSKAAEAAAAAVAKTAEAQKDLQAKCGQRETQQKLCDALKNDWDDAQKKLAALDDRSTEILHGRERPVMQQRKDELTRQEVFYASALKAISEDTAVQLNDAALHAQLQERQREKANLQAENDAVQAELKTETAKEEKLNGEIQLLHEALSFDQRRAALQPGHACPLCGSLDHPYCNHPQSPTFLEEKNAACKKCRAQCEADQKKLTEIAKKLQENGAEQGRLEGQQTEHLRLRRQYDAQRREALKMLGLPEETSTADLQHNQPAGQTEMQNLATDLQLLDQCAQKRPAAVKNAADLQHKWETHKGKLDTLKTACEVAQKLLEVETQAQIRAQNEATSARTVFQTLVAEKFPEGRAWPENTAAYPKIWQQLKERMEAYQKKKNELQGNQTQCRDLEARLAALRPGAREAQKARDDAARLLKIADDAWQTEAAAWQHDFGKDDPAVELQRALKQDNELQEKAAKADQTAHNRQSDSLIAKRNYEDAQTDYALMAQDERQFHDQFRQLLLSRNFADEKAVEAAEFRPGEETLLTDQKAQLEKDSIHLQGRRMQLETNVPPVNGRPAEELRNEVLNNQQEATSLKTELAKLTTAYENWKKQEAKAPGLKEQLDAKNVEFSHWKELDDIVGDSTGKKFKRIIQQFTLNTVLGQANAFLSTMTSGRYRLVGADAAVTNLSSESTQALDLFIQEAHNPAKMRTVNTLSGGEQFIVSLALALGLSKTNGEKIHNIQSLFLDEGFGSLDEDAIDAVMAGLKVLHEGDGQVGLITHVDYMKRIIVPHLLVTERPGGYSEVSGEIQRGENQIISPVPWCTHVIASPAPKK